MAQGLEEGHRGGVELLGRREVAEPFGAEVGGGDERSAAAGAVGEEQDVGAAEGGLGDEAEAGHTLRDHLVGGEHRERVVARVVGVGEAVEHDHAGRVLVRQDDRDGEWP